MPAATDQTNGSSSYLVVASRDDVRKLANFVFDPGRRKSIVLVSVATDTKEPRVDVQQLADRVGTDGAVVVLSNPEASWIFTGLAGSTLSVYGGGIRVITPQPDTENPHAHPMFTTYHNTDPDVTIARICHFLTNPNTTQRVSHSTATGEPSNPTSESDVDASSGISAAAYNSLESQYRSERERSSRLTSDLNEARKQIRALETTVEELRAQLTGRNLFGDPIEQLHHEIWISWLESTSEHDRSSFPIRDYSLGPVFLASVDAQESAISRERIISACVDVVSSRVWGMASRKPRPVREREKSPNALQRVDGATAYRARVQTNAPAARRILWWERPDGSPELAAVAVHDDMSALNST